MQEKVSDRKANPGGIVNPKKKAPRQHGMLSSRHFLKEEYVYNCAHHSFFPPFTLSSSPTRCCRSRDGGDHPRKHTAPGQNHQAAVGDIPPCGAAQGETLKHTPRGHVQSDSRMWETPGSLLPQVPHKKAIQSPAWVWIPGI